MREPSARDEVCLVCTDYFKKKMSKKTKEGIERCYKKESKKGFHCYFWVYITRDDLNAIEDDVEKYPHDAKLIQVENPDYVDEMGELDAPYFMPRTELSIEVDWYE